MEELRKHFPALKNQTYLNTASSGLISTSLHQWRKQQEEDFLTQGANYVNRKKIIETTRKTVARFFNAQLNEVALIPNFSFGINVLLDGIPSDKKILLLEGDYPSTSWPILQRGFKTCYAPIDEHLEQHIERAIEKHRPDIFIFSIVQWLSGIKIDFNFLKQLKTYHSNIIFIADGTQYMGTEAFDFHDSPIDVLGASGYKWMLSGFGNGFLFVKENIQPYIIPKTIGFNSAERFDSTPPETTFIKHFEPGHQDALNYGSLEQSICFIQKLGFDKISAKRATLAEKARIALGNKGVLSNATVYRKEHSAILNFSGSMDLFHKLTQKGLICSPRGGGIRVSFNFYNTEEELDSLLSFI